MPAIIFKKQYFRLKIGHMYNAATGKMYSVTNSTLDLFNFGEMGHPPEDYAFSFKAGQLFNSLEIH